MEKIGGEKRTRMTVVIRIVVASGRRERDNARLVATIAILGILNCNRQTIETERDTNDGCHPQNDDHLLLF